MAIIGESHNQMQKDKPEKVTGEIICEKPTSSLTKGKVYKIRGHFCYLKKMFLGGGDYCWVWYQFFTLKNDYGYTVKVNRRKFSVKAEVDRKKKEKLEYEMNPLNIMMEANQLTPQRYIS